jgi:ankyrin repeat protein
VDELAHYAATGQTAQLMSVLRLLPSDVSTKKLRDQRQATPLHYAAHNGHVDVCEALIGRFGSDLLYIKDLNRRTPLHCALHGRRLDVVCYLLHLSPDLEWHDNLGYSCARMLHGLPSRDQRELLTRLEPEALDPQLVLHLSVLALTERDVTQALRYCRVAPVAPTPFLRPPLHLAAEMGYAEVVQALLNTDVVRKAPPSLRKASPSPAPVPTAEAEGEEVANTSFETLRKALSQPATDSDRLTSTPRTVSFVALPLGDTGSKALDGKHDPHALTDAPLDAKSVPETLRTDSGIGSCSPSKVKVKVKAKVKVREPDVVSELDTLLEEVGVGCHVPSARDADGHLAFHYACQHGHTGLLEMLYFPDMDQRDFLKGVRLALSWKRYEQRIGAFYIVELSAS